MTGIVSTSLDNVASRTGLSQLFASRDSETRFAQTEEAAQARADASGARLAASALAETFRRVLDSGTGALYDATSSASASVQGFYRIGNAVTFDWVLRRVTMTQAQESRVLREATTSARAKAAVAFLGALRSGDLQEQQETWEYLSKVLDKDRPSHRKLFADE